MLTSCSGYIGLKRRSLTLKGRFMSCKSSSTVVVYNTVLRQIDLYNYV